MENIPNRKINRQEEQRALNYLCRYTTNDPTWPKGSITTKKVGQKRSSDPDIPDEIDFLTTYSWKENNMNYLIRVRKNEEGKMEFFTVNKSWGADRELGMPGLKPLSESFGKKIEPITKEEEDQIIQLLRFTYGLDKRFRKTLKKINHKISKNPYISDRIEYMGEFENGSKSRLAVVRNRDGELVYWILDPQTGEPTQNRSIPLNENFKLQPTLLTKEEEERGLNYIRQRLLPLVMEWYNDDYNDVDRNEHPIIRHGRDEELIRKSLRKVDVETYEGYSITQKKNVISNRIIYKANWGLDDLYFMIEKINFKVLVGYIDRFGDTHRYDIRFDPHDVNNTGRTMAIGNTLKGYKSDVIMENSEPKNLITKSEHDQTLNYIKRIIKKQYPDTYQFIFRELKRIKDKPENPKDPPNSIRYATGKSRVERGYVSYRIVKLDGRILVQDLSPMSLSYGKWFSEDPEGREAPQGWDLIRENGGPNLHISKEEEYYALSRIKLRKNNQGEKIGKYLKKKDHVISKDHQQSDRITYLDTNTESTYTIVKNSEGKLGVCFGYIAPTSATGRKLGNDFVSDTIDLLTENTPTGDWQSWEMITQPERNNLKLVLPKLQEYYKKYYNQNLSSTKIFLLQKVIDNLDQTDPRPSAKPLAKFGMEDRLFMMNFVDRKDTTGMASNAFDFLIKVSSQYIEPIRFPKKDIELKGITDIVSPYGRNKGDVFISGIEDIRPVINFGYGPYTLDSKFMNKFLTPGSYLDLTGMAGQETRIVNMSEVMRKVKEAIEKYNQQNLSEALSDDPRYQEATRIMIERNRFTKKEEELIHRYLSNIVIDGVRLGKTLKKIYHTRTTSPFDTDRIDYTAMVNGKEKLYRVVKSSCLDSKGRRHAIIRDASVDGEFGKIVKINLLESSSNQPKMVLSKEDEARAVNFINNLVYGGQRLGKTLKKVKITKSDNPLRSNGVIYSAKLNDSNNTEISFEIFRSWRRGLVAIDQVNYYTYTIDKIDQGLI